MFKSRWDQGGSQCSGQSECCSQDLTEKQGSNPKEGTHFLSGSDHTGPPSRGSRGEPHPQQAEKAPWQVLRSPATRTEDRKELTI